LGIIIRIIKKIICRIFLYSILTLITLLFFPYFFYNVYKFPEVTVFKGECLYNPYSGMDSTKWLKGNFHGHSRVWLGLTNGSKNKLSNILTLYKGLEYDIIGISDYMRINKYISGSTTFVSSYEHGYGFSKSHQIVLGDDKVVWFDFPLFQTINCRQEVFNRIKNDNNIVAIVHPSMNKAYEPEDLKYLTNYDCMEVLRHDRNSSIFWDAALSSGHYVSLLADDDNHDIESSGETGRCFTMINSKSKSQGDILNAIKKGNTYGVDYLKGDKDFDAKRDYLPNLAKLQNVQVDGNNITIQFSKPFIHLNFIGQNSEIKKQIDDSSIASYAFTDADTYIRAEAVFKDDIKFYLNPFIRYDGKEIKKSNVEIDYVKSYLLRGIFILIPVAIFLLIYFRSKKQ
jgi:hypothetical protein